MSDHLLRLRRGHAPNCSSGSSVVGVALVSATVAGVILNAWADRFLRWTDAPPPADGPPRLRPEVFGAILAWAGVQLHLSPAWAAAAHAAGALPVGGDPPVPGALSAPTEAHLSLTDRCPASCSGCYLSAGPQADTTAEPDAAALEAAIDQLAAMGVLEVALGGGEALLRPELLRLARYARQRGVVPNLTTSGFGLTDTLARELAEVMGQINISLDGLGPVYVQARGWDGAARGLAALERLAQAGARVGVNTVLTRPLLETPGALEALGAAIQQAGAVEWQWLRFKPVGRGADTWARLAPDTATLRALWPRALALEAQTGLTLRYDCAMTPFLAAEELPVERLARLGVAGCVGGESLWARDAQGGWAPCSFAAATPTAAADAPLDLRARWRADADLLAWRARAADPPEPCASCTHRTICRGGCRAVAAFLTGDPLAPDPQCPRVVAHAAGEPA